MQAFAIDNANEVKGGAIATHSTSTSTSVHSDNWYLFKENNPSGDDPRTTETETGHTDYI